MRSSGGHNACTCGVGGVEKKGVGRLAWRLTMWISKITFQHSGINIIFHSQSALTSNSATTYGRYTLGCRRRRCRGTTPSVTANVIKVSVTQKKTPFDAYPLTTVLSDRTLRLFIRVQPISTVFRLLAGSCDKFFHRR